MKLRSVLMMALKNHLTRTEMSQAQAAKRFGVTQPPGFTSKCGFSTSPEFLEKTTFKVGVNKTPAEGVIPWRRCVGTSLRGARTGVSTFKT